MKRFGRSSLMLGVIGVVAVCSLAFAGKPPKPGGGGCPRDIMCADVWIPVRCADGVVYSNQCYADRACAPGPCVRVEGGPIEVE